VHVGLAEQRVAERAAVLATAYAAHPERFPASRPKPAASPTEVRINPPKPRALEEVALTHAMVSEWDLRETNNRALRRGLREGGPPRPPRVWRVARSILVTESDAEADDYMAAPESALAFDFKFMHYSFSNARKALFMLKSDPNVPDESFTPEAARRGVVIAGGPRRVLDQLVALRDEIGPFGTLLMTGHDWDQPKLWRRSMELLATDVMPKLSRHAR
jgi:alkanesulfonate monooxygenase SsuD/methylene tetrahydromethanopterin reductase-like flavin-dependent oxidoreductase (luciferase family)